MVAGEAGQAAALLRSKQVDALSLYDAQYALIENAGVKPLRLLDTGPIAQYPSNGFLALEETLKENRAQAVGLAQGLRQGHDLRDRTTRRPPSAYFTRCIRRPSPPARTRRTRCATT